MEPPGEGNWPLSLMAHIRSRAKEDVRHTAAEVVDLAVPSKQQDVRALGLVVDVPLASC